MYHGKNVAFKIMAQLVKTVFDQTGHDLGIVSCIKRQNIQKREAKHKNTYK